MIRFLKMLFDAAVRAYVRHQQGMDTIPPETRARIEAHFAAMRGPTL